MYIYVREKKDAANHPWCMANLDQIRCCRALSPLPAHRRPQPTFQRATDCYQLQLELIDSEYRSEDERKREDDNKAGRGDDGRDSQKGAIRSGGKKRVRDGGGGKQRVRTQPLPVIPGESVAPPQGLPDLIRGSPGGGRL